MIDDDACTLDPVYELEEAAWKAAALRAYLVRGRPAYYGDWALSATLAWDVLGRLAESVRTGRAVGSDLATAVGRTEDTWRAHTHPVLAEWPERARDARSLWQQAGVAPGGTGRFDVLDPACGPGVTSFTLAHLLLFGRILHFLDDAQAAVVLAKARQALRPDGSLVVHKARADDDNGPGGYLEAMMLLGFAPSSHVRTFAEYAELLETTGFRGIGKVSGSVITATR